MPRKGGVSWWWVGERLERARLAYADWSVPLKVSAARLLTHENTFKQLARIHGWPRRGKRYRYDRDKRCS